MSDCKEYSIVSLKNILLNNERDDVEEYLSGYKSIYDDSTSIFLRRKAIDLELRDVSRTRIAISNESAMLRFFTLSIKCLRVPHEKLLSSKVLRSMNIESKTDVAQSYILGQLSRSNESSSGFGRILIREALERVQICKTNVGCRMLRLDCTDEMKKYYEDIGFRKISKNQEGDLNQMMTFI